MNIKQHINNNKTIAIFLTIVLMTVLSVGVVGAGHLQNVDTEYDYTEVNNPSVNYGDVVSIFDADGEGPRTNGEFIIVDEDDTLPNDNGNRLEQPGGDLVTLDGDNVVDDDGNNELRFGTVQTFGLYDDDPRGEYTVRGLSQGGELTVPSQEQGAGANDQLVIEAIEVPEEPTSADYYYVRVEDNSTGNLINSNDVGGASPQDAVVVEAGNRYEDILVNLNQNVPSSVDVYLKEADETDVFTAGGTTEYTNVLGRDNVTEEQVNGGNFEEVPVAVEDVDTDSSGDDPSTGDSDLISGKTSADSELDGYNVQATWTLQSAFEQGAAPGTTNGDADPDDGEVQLDAYDRDTRLFVDFLDEETEATQTIEAGQDLVISGNLADNGVSDSGQTYLVEKVVEDGSNTVVTEVAIGNSETVNQREILVNTSYPDTDSEVELNGEYQLVTDGGDTILAQWRATQQTFNAEFLNDEGTDGLVNLNTEETTTELNLSGTRIDYDVIVGAQEELEAQELEAIFSGAAGDQVNSIERVDYDDGDDEAYFLRLNGIAQSGTSQNVTADFDGQDAQEYEFNVSVADTDVNDNATAEVVFGSTGDADFSQGNYDISRGDTVEMNLTLSDTEVATFGFDEPDKYDIQFEVRDTDDDDNVSIQFDTYRADEYQTRDVTEVFNVTSGEIINPDTVDLPRVSGDGLSTGVYRVESFVDGEPTDVASVNIAGRNTTDINTYVLPKQSVIDSNRDLDLEEVLQNGTQQENVALGDVLVLELQASGVFSQSLIDNDTEGAALLNETRRNEEVSNYMMGNEPDFDASSVLDEVNVRIEGEPSDNKPAPEFRFENAENVIADAENETVYVLFRTNSDEVFTSLDGNFPTDRDGEGSVINDEDMATDYTVRMNMTEEYKFEDDNNRNLTDEFEIVNRTVKPDNLDNIVTDPQELDTKYALPANDNETVEAVTNIAPGSELQIRITSEGLNPYRVVEDVVVQETDNDQNQINGTFNFSTLDPGRNMSIRFFPLDDEERDAQIVEPPEPPEINDLNVTTPVTVGDTAEFEANVTNTQGSAIAYNWEFGDNETSGLAEPAHVYDEADTYNVTLTTTNQENGLSTNDTLEVFVEETPNQPPTVESLIGPTEVDAGESVQFGVLASDDGPNDELQYQWDFENGNSGVGATVTNTYTAEGTYTVQVNITDGEGEQTSTNQVVQVGDGEDAGGNESGNANLSVTVQDATNQQPISGATVSIDNQNTEASPDSGDTTDANGELDVELVQSNYVLTIRADGYQDATESLQLQGDDSLTVNMQPEQDSGGEENNSTEEDPDQPGFTLLLGALVLIVAGAFIYYRREIAGPSHPLK